MISPCINDVCSVRINDTRLVFNAAMVFYNGQTHAIRLQSFGRHKANESRDKLLHSALCALRVPRRSPATRRRARCAGVNHNDGATGENRTPTRSRIRKSWTNKSSGRKKCLDYRPISRFDSFYDKKTHSCRFRKSDINA